MQEHHSLARMHNLFATEYNAQRPWRSKSEQKRARKFSKGHDHVAEVARKNHQAFFLSAKLRTQLKEIQNGQNVFI